MPAHRLMMQLAQPALSYLMDHAVAGCCLLPGAAMLEAATAASATLAETSSPSSCLAGISIPAPVVLQAGRLQTLTCLANALQGGVQLQESSVVGPGVYLRHPVMCFLPVTAGLPLPHIASNR